MKAAVTLTVNPLEIQKSSVFMVAESMTIREWLDQTGVEFAFPTVCFYNGEPTLRAEWLSTKIVDGDVVNFAALPPAGGQESDVTQILLTILLIIVAIMIPQASGALTTPLWGTGAAALTVGEVLAVVVLVGGQLALSALFPPPGLDEQGASQSSPTYQVASQQNLNRLGQPIEVLYGRFNSYPSLCAQPYTDYDADGNQWLYQLMLISQGYVDFEEIRIGENTARQFDSEDLEWAIYEPYEPPTLFPSNVVVPEAPKALDLKGSEFDFGEWSRDRRGWEDTHGPSVPFPESAPPFFQGWYGPFTIIEENEPISRIDMDIELSQGMFAINTENSKEWWQDILVRTEIQEVDRDGDPVFTDLLLDSGNAAEHTGYPSSGGLIETYNGRPFFDIFLDHDPGWCTKRAEDLIGKRVERRGEDLVEGAQCINLRGVIGNEDSNTKLNGVPLTAINWSKSLTSTSSPDADLVVVKINYEVDSIDPVPVNVWGGKANDAYSTGYQHWFRVFICTAKSEIEYTTASGYNNIYRPSTHYEFNADSGNGDPTLLTDPGGGAGGYDISYATWFSLGYPRKQSWKYRLDASHEEADNMVTMTSATSQNIQAICVQNRFLPGPNVRISDLSKSPILKTFSERVDNATQRKTSIGTDGMAMGENEYRLTRDTEGLFRFRAMRMDENFFSDEHSRNAIAVAKETWQFSKRVTLSSLKTFVPERRSYGFVTLLAVRMRGGGAINQSTSRKINVTATRRLNIFRDIPNLPIVEDGVVLRPGFGNGVFEIELTPSSDAASDRRPGEKITLSGFSETEFVDGVPCATFNAEHTMLAETGAYKKLLAPSSNIVTRRAADGPLRCKISSVGTSPYVITKSAGDPALWFSGDPANSLAGLSFRIVRDGQVVKTTMATDAITLVDKSEEIFIYWQSHGLLVGDELFIESIPDRLAAVSGIPRTDWLRRANKKRLDLTRYGHFVFRVLNANEFTIKIWKADSRFSGAAYHFSDFTRPGLGMQEYGPIANYNSVNTVYYSSTGHWPYAQELRIPFEVRMVLSQSGSSVSITNTTPSIRSRFGIGDRIYLQDGSPTYRTLKISSITTSATTWVVGVTQEDGSSASQTVSYGPDFILAKALTYAASDSAGPRPSALGGAFNSGELKISRPVTYLITANDADTLTTTQAWPRFDSPDASPAVGDVFEVVMTGGLAEGAAGGGTGGQVNSETGWTTDPVRTRSIAWAAADILTDTTYGAGINRSRLVTPSFKRLDHFWGGKGEYRGSARDEFDPDAWTDATVYFSGDRVLYNSKYYQCVDEHTSQTGNNEPPDESFWRLAKPGVSDYFDGIFDSSRTLINSVQSVLGAGRASMIIVNGRDVDIVRDEEQSIPVAVFSDRNIVAGSLEIDYLMYHPDEKDSLFSTYRDATDWKDLDVHGYLPNTASAFQDPGTPGLQVGTGAQVGATLTRDDGSVFDQEMVGDTLVFADGTLRTIQDVLSETEAILLPTRPVPYQAFTIELGLHKNPDRLTLFGITSREQAWRETIHRLSATRLRRRSVSFQTELEGLIPNYGDKITVSSEFVNWAESGDVINVETDAPSEGSTTLTLSRPVRADTGISKPCDLPPIEVKKGSRRVVVKNTEPHGYRVWDAVTVSNVSEQVEAGKYAGIPLAEINREQVVSEIIDDYQWAFMSSTRATRSAGDFNNVFLRYHDPTFEDGNTSVSTLFATVSSSNTESHTGLRSIKVVGTNGQGQPPGIFRSLTYDTKFKTGAKWRFGAWIKGEGSMVGKDVYLRMRFVDSTGTHAIKDPPLVARRLTADWQYFFVDNDIDLADTDKYDRVYGQVNTVAAQAVIGDTYYVDSWEMRPVTYTAGADPQPATLLPAQSMKLTLRDTTGGAVGPIDCTVGAPPNNNEVIITTDDLDGFQPYVDWDMEKTHYIIGQAAKLSLDARVTSVAPTSGVTVGINAIEDGGAAVYDADLTYASPAGVKPDSLPSTPTGLPEWVGLVDEDGFPRVPMNVQLLGSSKDMRLKISWNPVPGSVGYQIQVNQGLDAYEGWTSLGFTNSREYLTPVLPGIVRLRVRPYNWGFGSWAYLSGRAHPPGGTDRYVIPGSIVMQGSNLDLEPLDPEDETSVRDSQIVMSEVPLGYKDGVNTSFQLRYKPVRESLVKVETGTPRQGLVNIAAKKTVTDGDSSIGNVPGTGLMLMQAYGGVNARFPINVRSGSKIVVIDPPDLYLSSGSTGGSAWSGGSVSYNKPVRVSHGGSSYRCKVNHVSDGSSEPGVGESWQTYWYDADAVGDLVATADNIRAVSSLAGLPISSRIGVTAPTSWASGIDFEVGDYAAITVSGFDIFYVATQASGPGNGGAVEPEVTSGWREYWREMTQVEATNEGYGALAFSIDLSSVTLEDGFPDVFQASFIGPLDQGKGRDTLPNNPFTTVAGQKRVYVYDPGHPFPLGVSDAAVSFDWSSGRPADIGGIPIDKIGGEATPSYHDIFVIDGNNYYFLPQTVDQPPEKIQDDEIPSETTSAGGATVIREMGLSARIYPALGASDFRVQGDTIVLGTAPANDSDITVDYPPVR